MSDEDGDSCVADVPATVDDREVATQFEFRAGVVLDANTNNQTRIGIGPRIGISQGMTLNHDDNHLHVDDDIEENTSGLHNPVTAAFTDVVQHFRAATQNDPNAIYDYIGETNRIQFYTLRNPECYTKETALRTYDAVWGEAAHDQLWSYISKKTGRNRPVYPVCLIIMHRVSSYITVVSDDKINIDQELLVKGQLPVIVEGNLVGMVIINAPASNVFILELWSPKPIFDESWHTLPIDQWHPDSLRKALCIVDDLIRCKDAFTGGPASKIQRELINNIYFGDIKAITKYLGGTQCFNFQALRSEQLEDKLADYEAQFVDQQSWILSTATAINETNVILNALKAGLGIDCVTTETINNSRIVRWYGLGNHLHLWTDDIYMRPDHFSPEYDEFFAEHTGINIGSYNIIIKFFDLDAGASAIQIFAEQGAEIDGYESGMQAPHVFNAGNACFGTYIDAVSDAYAAGDIPLLIDILIMFLSTATASDSAGKYWPKWLDEDIEIE